MLACVASGAMAEEGTEDPVAAAVLDANTAFYAAFSNGDIDEMAALWAEQHDVSTARPRSSLPHPLRHVVERLW